MLTYIPVALVLPIACAASMHAWRARLLVPVVLSALVCALGVLGAAVGSLRLLALFIADAVALALGWAYCLFAAMHSLRIARHADTPAELGWPSCVALSLVAGAWLLTAQSARLYRARLIGTLVVEKREGFELML